MDAGLLVLCALTFVIHLIGTLAYAVRITGTRTGRIAMSLSLFNILVLVSRTSNSFQGPLLAKRVELNIQQGTTFGVGSDFRWMIAAATVATILGAVLIPSGQRLFGRYVEAFSRWPSIGRVFSRAWSPATITHVRESLVLPRWDNVARAHRGPHIPWSVVLVNMAVMAIWTVGVFAPFYAGYLNPDLRLTASQLSGVINGVATILMFLVIDPYLSVLTDNVARGTTGEPYFRRSIVWLTGSRLAGTVLAQVLLVPAALILVTVCEWWVR
jgi:hypothetical protein